MNKKTLLYIWGGLFILCALLGFIPQPRGLAAGLLTAVGMGFFVPGGLLLYLGNKTRDLGPVKLVRNLSLCSLGVTLGLLMLNFLSGNAPEAAGEFLYGVLTVASAPMVCCQYWALSLFAWACLLMSALSLLKKWK